MYQPCTSTTVNSGQQRGLTVTPKCAVISPNPSLPGTAGTVGPGLITRRSWVQIPFRIDRIDRLEVAPETFKVRTPERFIDAAELDARPL